MQHAGQIVGDTRSGKPIYAFCINDVLSFPHPGNRGFLLEDHFDAYIVFEVLMLRAKRRFGPRSTDYNFYQSHRDAHGHISTLIFDFDRIKALAGCHDAFDLAELGRSLCRPEFKNL